MCLLESFPLESTVAVSRLGRDLYGQREEMLFWIFFSLDCDRSTYDSGIQIGTSVVAQYSGTESQNP